MSTHDVGTNIYRGYHSAPCKSFYKVYLKDMVIMHYSTKIKVLIDKLKNYSVYNIFSLDVRAA
ncbi:hypothetical protein J27TS7_35250 [Paenibacillus dendritiformis]|nr:hypothetical protein J27TS7_35250 [Paenibacillus dendritiformis]